MEYTSCTARSTCLWMRSCACACRHSHRQHTCVVRERAERQPDPYLAGVGIVVCAHEHTKRRGCSHQNPTSEGYLSALSRQSAAMPFCRFELLMQRQSRALPVDRSRASMLGGKGEEGTHETRRTADGRAGWQRVRVWSPRSRASSRIPLASTQRKDFPRNFNYQHQRTGAAPLGMISLSRPSTAASFRIYDDDGDARAASAVRRVHRAWCVHAMSRHALGGFAWTR